jgi:hypothetical protein
MFDCTYSNLIKENNLFSEYIKVSLDGAFLYCGTTSGDILMIYIPAAQFKSIGPEKKKYSMGITAMQALVNGDILIGTGEGKVHLTEKETFKSLK